MDNNDIVNSAPLTLRITDRRGNTQTFACDSVKLCAKDSAKGTQGGWIGIHRGHMPALISLANAPVSAFLAGDTVCNYAVTGGIAHVCSNIITVFPE